MSEEKYKIAIIMTCYNRKATTLSCLEAVFKQILPDDICVQVYLVDDGSTDGTGEAVRYSFPEVIILEGDGNLFWNGGMYLAFSKAMEGNYDYYLWLNDDAILFSDALSRLIETSNMAGNQSIIVGSMKDIISGNITYGGLKKACFFHPLNFTKLIPADMPQKCDTMNGNCVLIPRLIALAVGNLDCNFTHSIGDIDYGLRAIKKDYSIYITPKYLGTCSVNSTTGTWRDPTIPLLVRLDRINQPKGLPFREWQIYNRRHGGIFWFLYWLRPYLGIFLTSGWYYLKCIKRVLIRKLELL